MIVTLRELLTAPIFSNSEPLAGKGGLDSNVTSLFALDGPAGYTYTEPDMLVVTSGYFLSKEDEGTQVDLIEKLAARGVAGMAIKTRYFEDDRIPQALISRAESLNFPLIALSNSASSFRDFFTFFYANLYCRGLKSFLKREDFPIMFIQCIKAKSILGLSEKLSLLLERTVAVLFDQIVHTFPSECADSEFTQKISGHSSQQQIHPSRLFPGLLEFRCDGAESGRPVIGTGAEFTYKSNVLGSIWIDCTELPPDENDAAVLKSAQLACEIENKHLMDYRMEQEQYRAHFIELLLSGQMQPEQEALLLSASVNWRIPMETQVLVISCTDHAELYLDIGLAVREFFLSNLEANIVYLYQNRVVVFLSHAYINQTGFCAELRKTLEEHFPNDRFILSLGHAVTMKNANLSYEQAKYAALIGEQLDSGQPFHEFRKLGFYRLTCPDALPDERVRFCNDYLGALLEMNKTANLDLLNTLRTYFECHENYSRTGKALFMRPNAVRYRLDIIEKACGIRFSDHFDALNMKVALYLLPVMKNKASSSIQ
jgi:purine catabolism regulator